MKIIETNKYKSQIREITFYIKKDKSLAALNFASELKKSINNLGNFPYKYKQSIYFRNKYTRDMTFKGYTVIYQIFEDRIEIMSIFNQNKPN